VRTRVVDDAEVDQGEPLGSSPLDLVDRAGPGLEVEVRWRSRRRDLLVGLDAYARSVPRIQRPVGVEIGDVVPGVPRRWEALEPEGGLADDVDALLRHRRELAPEIVERVPVEAAGAVLQLRGVDEVRGADLRDMDLQRRVLADEDARGAGVVEMDMAEQQMAQVGELDAALLEPSLERWDAARRPAVEEREPVVGLDEIGADYALGASMVEVDQVGDPAILAGSSLLGNYGLLDHEEVAVPLDGALEILVLMSGSEEEPRWMRTDVGVLRRRETDGVDAGDI
jgi:hypothetical protein